MPARTLTIVYVCEADEDDFINTVTCTLLLYSKWPGKHISIYVADGYNITTEKYC